MLLPAEIAEALEVGVTLGQIHTFRLVAGRCSTAQAEGLLRFRDASAPVLRPVPDVQDFDYIFGGTVHNDVRRADELAGSLHLSGSAKAGEGCQLFDAVDNRLSDTSGSGRIVLLDALNSGFKLVRRFGCPPNLPHE